MKMSTIAGFGSGLAFILISIMLSGKLGNFYNAPSVMIVLGGTIAATVISYNFNDLKQTVAKLKDAFTGSESNLEEDLDTILVLARKARIEGLLSLDGQEFDEPFLEKGIALVVDGTDPELVKDIMEAEIERIENEDTLPQKVLNSMAAFAPAYGMIGTLIGLINMLTQLSDAAALGPSMSVALITTFYGTVLANLVFMPLAAKLGAVSEIRMTRLDLLLEGILSIQKGENPRMIKEKLDSYIPRTDSSKNEEMESGGEAYGKAQAEAVE